MSGESRYLNMHLHYDISARYHQHHHYHHHIHHLLLQVFIHEVREATDRSDRISAHVYGFVASLPARRRLAALAPVLSCAGPAGPKASGPRDKVAKPLHPQPLAGSTETGTLGARFRGGRREGRPRACHGP